MVDSQLNMKQSMPTKKSILILLAGLLIFLFYLYFFVGFEDIIEVIGNSNPINFYFYFSFAIVMTLLGVLSYSLTWRELLGCLSIKTSYWKVVSYCFVSNFVDLIIPLEAVSGEIVKTYLVANDMGAELEGDIGKIISSVISHRVISTFTILIGLVIGSFSIVFVPNLSMQVFLLLIIVLPITLFFFILLFLLSTNKRIAVRIVNLFLRCAEFLTRGRLNISDLKAKVHSVLLNFHQGIQVFRHNPRTLTKPLLFSFLAWFTNLITYLLVFYSLGVTWIPLNMLIIVYVVAITVQTLPVGLPVGLVEIVMSSLYIMFGVDRAISGTVTTLTRVATFWVQLLIGYVIIQWFGIKNFTFQKNKI